MSQPLPKWPLFLFILPYKTNKGSRRMNKQKHKERGGGGGGGCSARLRTAGGANASP